MVGAAGGVGGGGVAVGMDGEEAMSETIEGLVWGIYWMQLGTLLLVLWLVRRELIRIWRDMR